MKQVSIVMYHYVRELPYTRYPKIRALLASEFRAQLEYMSKYYEFVTMQECMDAINANGDHFPGNAALLTFDDGYIDHFTTVFPILEERGIQGCFFPPAKAVIRHEVLDVNKIQFIRAVTNVADVVEDLYRCLDAERSHYQLKSNEYYVATLSQEPQRYDASEDIFVKRLLQRELPRPLREAIVQQLFEKYVTKDEAAFARELYMTPDQLRCMNRHGMYVGSHGYDHCWESLLEPSSQEQQIQLSLDFLQAVGSPIDRWAICYPYGLYNDSLLRLLKTYRCGIGLTSRVGIGRLTPDNAFTLERLDTNDLPKAADVQPCEWTRVAAGGMEANTTVSIEGVERRTE